MTILLAILLQADPELISKEFKVGDAVRQGLVRVPAGEKPAPVVFAFHGHGGNSQHAARSFRIHKLWPEAIVVYLQGLPTPGMTDPEGKKPGWQKQVGDQDDRDLKLFDGVLEWLKKEQKIDEKRIYAMGHSNGGAFTYLLWSARAEVFAAFAPCAAGGRITRGLPPKPAMHIAGQKDPLVSFEVQKRAMEAVREGNGCEADGKDWDKGCLIYASSKGAPFVSFIHPGDHKFPDEAPALIVKFFKEQSKK